MKKSPDKPSPSEKPDTTIRIPKKPSRPSADLGMERVGPAATSPGLLIKITGKPREKGRKGEAANESILRVEGGEKYKVGPIVAEGGMGVVREAMDLTCRRIVAIKALPKGKDLPAEYRTRFIEEAQITSQLEHPNIVPVHELGFDVEHNVFYTMKFIKGVTLTKILLGIRRGVEDIIEQYRLARLLNIFQKVCDAVAFAHSRGIVHCDLKPDNIMICDFGEVVVMDWGLARPVGSVAPTVPRAAAAAAMADTKELTALDGASRRTVKMDLEGRTTTERVLGTPGFLAPERVTGAKTADTRSDIYSLGATLYSILTLRAPLSGENTKELLRRIIKGEILPPAAYNDPDRLPRGAGAGAPRGFPHCPDGKIPVALSDVAMKALATRLEERYAAVQEMQSEVEAYQTGLIWHLVVDQDFSGADPLARWEIIGGQCEIKNGELRMAYGEPQGLVYKGDLPGDVRIEFECRQEGVYLNSVGCFMSAVKSETKREIPLTGYKFEYGGFDNSLNMIERAGRQIAGQPVSALSRGTTYKVRAERVGPRLKMTVNNEDVLSIVDHDPLSGADRTAVGLFGWLAETVYSRVKIHTLGTPWKSDILDIAERQIQKGNYSVASALLQEVLDAFPEPQRLERARRASERAKWREEMTRNLAVWRERLEKAWAGAKFEVRLSNDGLSVEIPPNSVDDLAPLAGMPITSLVCTHNHIRSLEPLRGMPITSLNCTDNLVTSLEPLRGMNIGVLVCEGCPVESIDPLRGMPLTLLNIGGGRVEDLGPLRGMALTFLSCWGNRIRSLEPLSGMKTLAALYCNANPLEGLEPLRGLPIVTMNCSGTGITTLEPLRGMKISVLHCGDNAIESLEPLAGMPTKMLSCQCNRIRSLEPLKGAPLASLTCGSNLLPSVALFMKNPPDDFRFDCDTIPTEELERVHAEWAKDLRYADHAKNVEVLLALRRQDIQRLRKLASVYRGHRYLFIPKFLRWEEAKDFCEKMDGHLLTILGREENDFVTSLFKHGAWIWLGLVTKGEKHAWVTGEPFEYSNFVDLMQERKPGPKIFSGRWSADDVPHAHNSFVIEWDS